MPGGLGTGVDTFIALPLKGNDMNAQRGRAVSTGALSWARKAGGALLLSLVLVPLQSGWAQTCPNPLDIFPACGGGGGNTSPTFVAAGAGSLTVAQGASATDVKGLLHVSDSDAGQTMTWAQSAAPSHGTLSITGATASSGGADITPGGTITYTPTPGYSGTDSFAVAVDDGMGFATRTINVTISGRTVTVNALGLSGVTVGNIVNANVTAAGGFGTYTYSVIAGDLPAGLMLYGSGSLQGAPSKAGDYSFTIQATDSSTGTGPFSGTRTFTGTVGAAPGLRTLPPVPDPSGLTSEVTASDLNSGNGQQMVACLTAALTEKLNAAATYEGQNADGSARFSIATAPVQKLSFYPTDANTTSGAAGITPTGNNVLTVTTTCGTFSTVPALFNRQEFAALAQSMGMTVTINAEGVITVKSGTTFYVGRPDYAVTTGTPGAPSLKQGEDGLWRFTDSLGNVQILRPAFLGPQWLRVALANSIAIGPVIETFNVESDGTITLVLRDWRTNARERYTLTASQTLSPPVPSMVSVWSLGNEVFGYRVYRGPGLDADMSQSYTRRAIQ